MNYSMLMMARARQQETLREAGQRKRAGEARRAARQAARAALTAFRPGARRERGVAIAAAGQRVQRVQRVRSTVTGR